MRIALFGAGRMGREVAAVVAERGLEVAAWLRREDVEGDRNAARAALVGADVAVDFTTPSSVVSNIRLCLEAECPVVVGTTGWLGDLDEVRAAVKEHDGALLWAANFAPGVALMRALARQAGALLAGLDGFSAHLIETHHSGKRDAPSGTALAIGADVEAGLGRPLRITSVREGEVPGTHDLVIEGPYEQIHLTHEARGRRVFADGAVKAAHWLRGRKGVFTMDDVIGMTRL